VDVGGQRSERKKWFHCFENVNAIMFCVAISEYNLFLEEDPSVNRMRESMALFNEICNCDFFQKVSIIVFLNKIDLFKDKICRHNITTCFPEYEGKQNYKDASTHIRDVFVGLNNVKNKQIYCHFTCATNTKNIRFVFDVVKDTILQTALHDTMDIDYLLSSQGSKAPQEEEHSPTEEQHSPTKGLKKTVPMDNLSRKAHQRTKVDTKKDTKGVTSKDNKEDTSKVDQTDYKEFKRQHSKSKSLKDPKAAVKKESKEHRRQNSKSKPRKDPKATTKKGPKAATKKDAKGAIKKENKVPTKKNAKSSSKSAKSSSRSPNASKSPRRRGMSSGTRSPIVSDTTTSSKANAGRPKFVSKVGFE